jgi:hypothetical protein
MVAASCDVHPHSIGFLLRTNQDAMKEHLKHLNWFVWHSQLARRWRSAKSVYDQEFFPRTSARISTSPISV